MKYLISIILTGIFIFQFIVTHAAPNWSVNQGNYEYSMNITGIINIQGNEYTSQNDMVGAFYGNECRGVAHLVKLDKSDRYVALLSVYSNQAIGEEISFKVFSSSANRISDVPQTINFETDKVIGDPSVPFAWASPELSNKTEFLDIAFESPDVKTQINTDDRQIIVSIPKGMDKTGLVAFYTISEGAYARIGGQLQKSGVTPNNFTDPVSYTITAANGFDKNRWDVIVIDRELLQSTDFVRFSVPGQTQPATINSATHTIEVYLPKFADISSLKPEFIVQGQASVTIQGNEQESGVSVVDLSQPQTYTVTSEDGKNKQSWLVKAMLPDLLTGTDILSFSVEGQTLPSTINKITHLVTVKAPKDFDAEHVVPSFTLSDSAKAYINNQRQYSGKSTIDFSSPRVYTIVAEDTTYKSDWVVNIEMPPKSKETLVKSFTFPDVTISSDIDPIASRINITVEKNANIYKLTPEFELSENATAYIEGEKQISGVTEQSYSNTVTYQVVAEDNTVKKDWHVIVQLPELSDEADIISFSIEGQESPAVINPLLRRIDVVLGKEVSLFSIAPVFELSEEAKAYVDGTFQVSGKTTNNFTQPVTYEVRAEDGSIKNWTVTVSRPPLGQDAWFSDFSLPEQTAPAFINESIRRIDITVSQGTDLSSLQPEFSLAPGATAYIDNVVQQSGSSVVDFSSPVNYLIEAEDEETKKSWSVYVHESEAKTGCRILDYEIEGQIIPSFINDNENKIEVLLEKDVDLQQCMPVFSLSEGAEAEINGVEQKSGVTQVSLDEPAEYTITSEDKKHTENWTVTASVLCDTCEGAFLSYTVPNMLDSAFINPVSRTISLKTGRGTDLTSLIADFTLEQGASAYVDNIIQESGVTAHDFTSPVSYTVKTADMTDEYWEVRTFYPRKSDKAEFVEFTLPGQKGESIINPLIKRIDITVEKQTDITSLVPEFLLSKHASAFIGDEEQISGQSSTDFSNPVEYRVVAEDEQTTNKWQVYVSYPEPSGRKDILSYSLEGQKGEAVINKYMRRIDVSVPKDVDLTNLVATFELSPFAVAEVQDKVQVSGETTNDFTNPVTYTVTAEDGTTSDWLVVVSLPYLNNEADILTFEVNKQTGESIINYFARSIDITVSAGADVTKLIPTFTISDFATMYYNDEEISSGSHHVDFSSKQSFEVIAEDGINSKTWKVNVSKSPLSAQCEITSFSLPMQLSPSVINDNTRQIEVEMPSNIGLDTLKAEFTLSREAQAYVGDELQESGQSDNNFTKPLVYTVVAEDGSTSKDWIVIAEQSTDSLSSRTTFIEFRVEGQTSPTVINPHTHQIDIKVPFSEQLNNLTPEFVLPPNATATVNGIKQTSGISSNDFSRPVVYEITAENNISLSKWLVIVSSEAPSDKTDFHSFTVPGQIGFSLINNSTHRIYIVVTDDVDISSLSPGFELSKGATATVEEKTQVSGESVMDFSQPCIYHVVAENGTTWFDWVVNIIPQSKVGINNVFSQHQVSLSPNPCRDILNIRVPPEMTGEYFRIMTSSGQSGDRFQVVNTEMSLNLDTYSKGIYYLLDEKKRVMIPFVISD